MARRLIGDKVGQSTLKSIQKKEKPKDPKQKIIDGKKASSNTSLSNVMSSTEETIRDLKKELSKVSPNAAASLKDVIGQFHILIHNPNFSEELGMFLFNNIVNPYLYEAV